MAERGRAAVTRQGFDKNEISKIVRNEGAEANGRPVAKIDKVSAKIDIIAYAAETQ